MAPKAGSDGNGTFASRCVIPVKFELREVTLDAILLPEFAHDAAQPVLAGLETFDRHEQGHRLAGA